MGLNLPNVSVNNAMDPDEKDTNAKLFLTLARARAQNVASKQLCNCSCNCEKVTIRVQLYGGHWLTPQSRELRPKNANFLQSFYGGRRNSLFKDIDVKCDRTPSSK